MHRFAIKLITACYFLFVTGFSAVSQNHTIDSIQIVLKNKSDDTVKVNLLNKLGADLTRAARYDSAQTVNSRSHALAEKLNYKAGIAKALSNTCFNYLSESMYNEAIDYAHQALSLEMELNDKPAIANTYNSLANAYYNMSQYDTSLAYYEKAIQLATEIGNKKGLGMYTGNAGNLYYSTGEYGKALEYYEKARKLQQDEGDIEGVARDYGNEANVYTNLGNISKTLDCIYKSLAINKQHGFKPGCGFNYAALGRIYADQGDYKKALEFYRQSQQIKLELRDKTGEAVNLGNMGLIYENQGMLDTALLYEQKAIDLDNEVNSKDEAALSYSNMADIYNIRKEYDKALSNEFKSIAINKSIGATRGIGLGYIETGLTYAMKENFNYANAYLDSAMTIGHKLGENDIIKGVYQTRSIMDSIAGNPAMEIKDYKMFILYRDNLVNDENKKKAMQSAMNFEFEQKQAAEKAEQDKKEAIAEQQRAKQSIIRYSIFSFSALLLITLIAGFLYTSYNRKLRTQQEEFSRQLIMNIDDERKRIAIDLHDDIGQALSIVKSEIVRNTGLPQQKTKELENDIGIIIEQTREISKMLYPSTIEKIGLYRHIASLMEHIQSATGIECSYDITADIQKLPVTTQVQIARIIQECTNNTIKHSRASALKLSIYPETDNLIITYRDNGIGLQPDKNYEGLGLRSLYERTKIINGTLTIDAEPGNGFKLTLTLHYNNEHTA